MTNRMEMPRKRGSLIGTLLLIAGIWGALIGFVGPLFDWAVEPEGAFDMTEARFWLSLVPGLAVIAGALILTGAANRVSAGTGAWLAVAGGAWFAAGPTVSRAFDPGAWGVAGGWVERLTYFEGLGALIVALAAFALGRMTVRDQRDHDRLVHARETDAEAEHVERERGGRFTREPARAEATDAPAATAAGAERPRDRPIL